MSYAELQREDVIIAPNTVTLSIDKVLTFATFSNCDIVKYVLAYTAYMLKTKSFHVTHTIQIQNFIYERNQLPLF